jgi:aryl-alcohol dehydrogenase-like predicted oxidoreductase
MQRQRGAIALAWLLSKAVVANIILGASKLSQLEGNLGAIAVKLSDSQIAALDQITAPPSLYPNWFNTNMVDDKHKEIFGTNRAEPF